MQKAISLYSWIIWQPANQDHQWDLHNVHPKCAARSQWFTIFHDQGLITWRALGPLFMSLLLFDASSSWPVWQLPLRSFLFSTSSCRQKLVELAHARLKSELWLELFLRPKESTFHLFCLYSTKGQLDFVKSVLAIGNGGLLSKYLRIVLSKYFSKCFTRLE